mgnify:FL=1
MNYRGYLRSKDDCDRQIELSVRNTPNGAMYMTLTTFARLVLADNNPFIPENWELKIDRNGELAYEFSVEEGDWVEA